MAWQCVICLKSTDHSGTAITEGWEGCVCEMNWHVALMKEDGCLDEELGKSFAPLPRHYCCLRLPGIWLIDQANILFADLYCCQCCVCHWQARQASMCYKIFLVLCSQYPVADIGFRIKTHEDTCNKNCSCRMFSWQIAVPIYIILLLVAWVNSRVVCSGPVLFVIFFSYGLDYCGCPDEVWVSSSLSEFPHNPAWWEVNPVARSSVPTITV